MWISVTNRAWLVLGTILAVSAVAVGGHLARQGADVLVLEDPLGPKGNLDGLLAVGGHGVAVLGL